MTPYLLARAEIVKLVPEILELKSGCRVSWQGKSWKTGNDFPKRTGAIAAWVSRYGRKHYFVAFDGIRDVSDPFREEELDILGSPITLADVLRAIDKPVKYFSKNPTIHNEVVKLLYLWNLALDFEHQEESVHLFVLEILSK